MNGLRFLYDLVPFFVRRFLYAAANASIIGVTGSSLSGLDRYSNRMPFSRNFCRHSSSHLIAFVLRIAFQLFPLVCCRKLIRTGNADIKKYFHLASPSDVVRKSLNFQTISMLSRS